MEDIIPKGEAGELEKDVHGGWYPLGFDLPGAQGHDIEPSVHSERGGWSYHSRPGRISEVHDEQLLARGRRGGGTGD